MAETKALVVLDREHSEISPSGFDRAEHCTASVALRRQSTEEGEPSIYALQGSAAHAILERLLVEDLDIYDLKLPMTVEVKGQKIEVDDDMLLGVRVALDEVREGEHFAGRKAEYEVSVALPFTADLMGGKAMKGLADVIARERFPVVVLDYKSGFNLVEADSVQLGLYGLGGVHKLTYGAIHKLPPDEVAAITIVVQPNAEGGSTPRVHKWTGRDMIALQEKVIHVLKRVQIQDWTYAFGPWCKYCPALAICPHAAAVAKDAILTKVVATPELIRDGTMSAELLADYFELSEMFGPWAASVNRLALAYMVEGGKVRGAKVVRKGTHRRWAAEPETVATTIQELGGDPWQKKLITPAEAERRVPKVKH